VWRILTRTCLRLDLELRRLCHQRLRQWHRERRPHLAWQVRHRRDLRPRSLRGHLWRHLLRLIYQFLWKLARQIESEGSSRSFLWWNERASCRSGNLVSFNFYYKLLKYYSTVWTSQAIHHHQLCTHTPNQTLTTSFRVCKIRYHTYLWESLCACVIYGGKKNFACFTACYEFRPQCHKTGSLLKLASHTYDQSRDWYGTHKGSLISVSNSVQHLVRNFTQTHTPKKSWWRALEACCDLRDICAQ
jgi:hypothetical protein